MPLLGEPVRLSLQLHDGATNKFPLAYFFDSAGLPLGALPSVALTHIGEGLYINNELLFPIGTPEIRVSFKVFNDALFTQPSRKHSRAIDVFYLETTNNTQIIIVNESQVIGTLESDDNVEGVLEVDKTVAGEIDFEDAVGVLESETTLLGVIEQDEEIETIAFENGSLKGELE